jgi:hypothetical protein
VVLNGVVAGSGRSARIRDSDAQSEFRQELTCKHQVPCLEPLPKPPIAGLKQISGVRGFALAGPQSRKAYRRP